MKMLKTFGDLGLICTLEKWQNKATDQIGPTDQDGSKNRVYSSSWSVPILKHQRLILGWVPDENQKYRTTWSVGLIDLYPAWNLLNLICAHFVDGSKIKVVVESEGTEQCMV